MAVSRIDILNREFARSLRGYNPEEVDNFLHDVADTLGRLGDEKVALASRVVQLEARLSDFEQQEAALRNTLIATQRMTEDLKSSAQREAQLIIDAARMRADNLLGQANQRLSRIFDEIAEAKKLKNQFEISVRSVVESHLKILDMQKDNEARLDAGVARFNNGQAQNNRAPQQAQSERVEPAPIVSPIVSPITAPTVAPIANQVPSLVPASSPALAEQEQKQAPLALNTPTVHQNNAHQNNSPENYAPQNNAPENYASDQSLSFKSKPAPEKAQKPEVLPLNSIWSADSRLSSSQMSSHLSEDHKEDLLILEKLKTPYNG